MEHAVSDMLVVTYEKQDGPPAGQKRNISLLLSHCGLVTACALLLKNELVECLDRSMYYKSVWSILPTTE